MGSICHVNHAQWHLRINVKTREQLPDYLFIDEHWETVLCLVTAAEFSMITGMILSGFKSPRPTSWQCSEHCYWSLRQSRPICFSDTCFLTAGTTGMKWQICNCLSESCPSPQRETAHNSSVSETGCAGTCCRAAANTQSEQHLACLSAAFAPLQDEKFPPEKSESLRQSHFQTICIWVCFH